MGSESRVDSGELFHLRNDVNEMKIVLAKVADGINQLAVLGDRQATLTNTTNKILERIERIEERQHQADIDKASNASFSSRLAAVEDVVKEMHIDGERNKARISTATWLARVMWAVIAACGGGVVWLLNHLPNSPLIK
jgi:Flp pilus assembly protein TadB